METEQQFALPELVLRSRDEFAQWFFNTIKNNVESYSYDAFYDISQIIKKQHDSSLAWSKVSYMSLPKQPLIPWIFAVRPTGTFSSFDINDNTRSMLSIIDTNKKHYIITFSFMGDYYHQANFATIQEVTKTELNKYIRETELNNTNRQKLTTKPVSL